MQSPVRSEEQKESYRTFLERVVGYKGEVDPAGIDLLVAERPLQEMRGRKRSLLGLGLSEGQVEKSPYRSAILCERERERKDLAGYVERLAVALGLDAGAFGDADRYKVIGGLSVAYEALCSLSGAGDPACRYERFLSRALAYHGTVDAGSIDAVLVDEMLVGLSGVVSAFYAHTMDDGSPSRELRKRLQAEAGLLSIKLAARMGLEPERIGAHDVSFNGSLDEDALSRIVVAGSYVVLQRSYMPAPSQEQSL